MENSTQTLGAELAKVNEEKNVSNALKLYSVQE